MGVAVIALDHAQDIERILVDLADYRPPNLAQHGNSTAEGHGCRQVYKPNEFALSLLYTTAVMQRVVDAIQEDLRTQ